MLRGAQQRVSVAHKASRTVLHRHAPSVPLEAHRAARRFQGTLAALKKVPRPPFSSLFVRLTPRQQDDVKKLVSEGRKSGRYLIDVRERPEVEQTGAIPTAVVLPSTFSAMTDTRAYSCVVTQLDRGIGLDGEVFECVSLRLSHHDVLELDTYSS